MGGLGCRRILPGHRAAVHHGQEAVRTPPGGEPVDAEEDGRRANGNYPGPALLLEAWQVKGCQGVVAGYGELVGVSS